MALKPFDQENYTMNTIDELVKSLTYEEIVIHRKLIDECKEREITVKRRGENLLRDIDKLTDILCGMLTNFQELSDASQELNKACQEACNNIKSGYLSSIPDENFFAV